MHPRDLDSEMAECSFSWELIRGYHVYRSVWEATVGEQLNCVCKVGNPYVVAVIQPQNELIVGHKNIEYVLYVLTMWRENCMYCHRCKTPFSQPTLRGVTATTLGDLISHQRSPCTCRTRDFIMGVQKYLPNC